MDEKRIREQIEILARQLELPTLDLDFIVLHARHICELIEPPERPKKAAEE